MHKQKGLILFAVVIILILGEFYLWKTNQPTPIVSTGSEYMTISGQLISSDLSQMPMDGDGVYKIKAGNGSLFEVHLTSGETRCDREAIRIPNDPRDGSKVEARGKIVSNVLRICDSGTYIRGL